MSRLPRRLTGPEGNRGVQQLFGIALAMLDLIIQKPELETEYLSLAGPIGSRILHEPLPEIGRLLQLFCTVVDGMLPQER